MIVVKVSLSMVFTILTHLCILIVTAIVPRFLLGWVLGASANVANDKMHLLQNVFRLWSGVGVVVNLQTVQGHTYRQQVFRDPQ